MVCFMKVNSFFEREDAKSLRRNVSLVVSFLCGFVALRSEYYYKL